MRDCPLCRACENKICPRCASHECLNNDTDMSMPAPVDVELVDVTKRWGSVVAVEHLTLTIPAGTHACLLGPSGCGKTTTLCLLAGHERVTSGELRIGSMRVTHLPPAQRSRAGECCTAHVLAHPNAARPAAAARHPARRAYQLQRGHQRTHQHTD